MTPYLKEAVLAAQEVVDHMLLPTRKQAIDDAVKNRDATELLAILQMDFDTLKVAQQILQMVMDEEETGDCTIRPQGKHSIN